MLFNGSTATEQTLGEIHGAWQSRELFHYAAQPSTKFLKTKPLDVISGKVWELREVRLSALAPWTTHSRRACEPSPTAPALLSGLGPNAPSSRPLPSGLCRLSSLPAGPRLRHEDLSASPCVEIITGPDPRGSGMVP